MDRSNITITIKKDFPSLLEETIGKVQKHFPFLAAIWVFITLPTTIISINVSKQLSFTLSGGVYHGSDIFISLLKSLLLGLIAIIPTITIALRMKEDQEADNMTLLFNAVKKLPSFITTLLSVLIRLLPAVFIGIFAVFALAFTGTMAGMNIQTITYLGITLLFLVLFAGYIRFAAAPLFYVMNGIKNFKATSYSKSLYKGNKGYILLLFLLIVVIPTGSTYAVLYFVINRTLYLGLSIFIELFSFLTMALFANLLNHLETSSPQEIGG